MNNETHFTLIWFHVSLFFPPPSRQCDSFTLSNIMTDLEIMRRELPLEAAEGKSLPDAIREKYFDDEPLSGMILGGVSVVSNLPSMKGLYLKTLKQTNYSHPRSLPLCTGKANSLIIVVCYFGGFKGTCCLDQGSWSIKNI